jgi:hypothetical protein
MSLVLALSILAFPAINAAVTARARLGPRLNARAGKRSLTEHEAFQSLAIARSPTIHGVVPRSQKWFCATLRSSVVVIQGGRIPEAAVAARLFQRMGE